MKRSERIPDDEEIYRVVQDDAFARLRSATPGIIQSVDFTKMTCVVQPSIQEAIPLQTGNSQIVNLPLLVDVPLLFPGGGGYSMTFPVVNGDECLVIFADRCIDAWWQNGGIQPQAELRMHDLSDGFAIVGFHSQPRVIPTINQNTVQLRKNDGTAYYELTPAGVANIVAPGGVNISGNLNVNGNTMFTGRVKANGHFIDETHTHSGVQSGTSNSGVVT